MKFITAFLLSASVALSNPTGKLVFVYQTTDEALWADIQNAERWINFYSVAYSFSQSHIDAAMVGYWAGVRAHAQKQFDDSHKL